MRAGQAQDGFTVIEVIVAAVVLLVGITALFGLLDTSVRAIASTRAREGATNLARNIVEDATTIPYAQISPTAIEGDLKAMTGLADVSTAAGWQVVRNGITYTVTVSECSIDDPKNGYGVHDSTFCPESSTQGTADSQPANLKRITVEVTWAAIGRSPHVRQIGILTAAGESVGLSASGLKLTSPFESSTPLVASEPVSHELGFSVSAPSGTTAMVWSLDGVTQSPAPGFLSGTTWTFWWPIAGLSDGAYQVSAQAVNAVGVIGPPVTITVTLIRGEPAAPRAVVGGFNTVRVSGVAKTVVELQWAANTERNVIGYRVYRPGAREPAQLVCPASMATLSLAVSCIDYSPPSPTASNLTYSVVALYRRAEGETLSTLVSEGPAGTLTVTGGEPLPAAPNSPTGPLTIVHNSDGSVTLSWSAPSGGAAVSFYRIYRGSSDNSGRYDITGNGTTRTYTDTDATVTHSYWVTAVGANLAESAPLGPETG